MNFDRLPEEHVKKQVAYMKARRARGLCEYGGCRIYSWERSRCTIHAAKHALKMARLRQVAKEALLHCACGDKTAKRCSYYKSGKHIPVKLKPKRKHAYPAHRRPARKKAPEAGAQNPSQHAARVRGVRKNISATLSSARGPE